MKDDACESVHNCRNCGKEYMDWTPQSRYCSDQCRQAAAMTRNSTKVGAGRRMIKCLSVRQPWAWAIVKGYKIPENRTWKTAYRGPLLIHAGKTIDRDGIGTIEEFEMLPNGIVMPETFSTGAIIGSVNLIDIVHEENLTAEQRKDPKVNEWAFGPYCWILSHPVEFESPIPYKGQLGLFDVPAELLA